MNKNIDINGSLAEFRELMQVLEDKHPTGWEYKTGTPRLFFFQTNTPTDEAGEPSSHRLHWSVINDPLFNDEVARRASIECVQVGKKTTVFFRDAYAALYNQTYSGRSPHSFGPIGPLFDKFAEWVEERVREWGLINAEDATNSAVSTPGQNDGQGKNRASGLSRDELINHLRSNFPPQETRTKTIELMADILETSSKYSNLSVDELFNHVGPMIEMRQFKRILAQLKEKGLYLGVN